MAIQTAAMRAALATAYGNTGTFMAVYTTAPGAAAGTEPTGGTPAYARKPITWTVSGSTTTASATFDIPAGVTIVGFGLHSAVTAGSYYDGAGVTSQAFASQGQFTITATFTES